MQFWHETKIAVEVTHVGLEALILKDILICVSWIQFLLIDKPQVRVKKILDISVDVHWLYKVSNYIILQLWECQLKANLIIKYVNKCSD